MYDIHDIIDKIQLTTRIFNAANYDEKAEFLRMTCETIHVYSDSVRIEYKKPYQYILHPDIIAGVRNCSVVRARQDDIRTLIDAVIDDWQLWAA